MLSAPTSASYNPYQHVTFLKSAARCATLPIDSGVEVAFIGRSNAGKSSALNALTHNRKMAKTSKTPGRTQLINIFEVDPLRRLIDLPGYGYAKVPLAVKQAWQNLLHDYLRTRRSLSGCILLMDCRHLFTELDIAFIELVTRRDLKLHILLTKSDKLSYGQLKQQLQRVEKGLLALPGENSVQAFSALKKTGLEDLIAVLDRWFGMALAH